MEDYSSRRLFAFVGIGINFWLISIREYRPDRSSASGCALFGSTFGAI
jgi:hypothetical protein